MRKPITASHTPAGIFTHGLSIQKTTRLVAGLYKKLVPISIGQHYRAFTFMRLAFKLMLLVCASNQHQFALFTEHRS